MSRELVIWTIYDHPKDFPNCFIARKFLNDKPTGQVITSPKLNGLRNIMSELYGLTVIPRNVHDDPVIVECWF